MGRATGAGSTVRGEGSGAKASDAEYSGAEARGLRASSASVSRASVLGEFGLGDLEFRGSCLGAGLGQRTRLGAEHPAQPRA